MSGPRTRIAVQLTRGDFQLAVDVDFEARVTVIFGASGSGKSTLFEAVLGLHPARHAEIVLGGYALPVDASGRPLPLEARGLGWLPQDLALFPHAQDLVRRLGAHPDHPDALVERRPTR